MHGETVKPHKHISLPSYENCSTIQEGKI